MSEIPEEHDVAVPKSELDSILDSLTILQLRDIAFALKREHVIPEGKDRDELIAAIRQTADPTHLLRAAHKVETLSPFKHSYLFSFPDSDTDFVRTKVAQFCSAFSQEVGSVDLSSRELSFQFCLADVESDVYFVKLVHSVPHFEWAETTEKQRNLNEFLKRHPVVLAFRPAEHLVTASFPGFSQGSGTPDKERIRYPEIASQAQSFTRDYMEVDLSALEIRKAVETLLASSALEVRDVRRRARPATGGRIDIDASELGFDTGTYLQRVFGGTGSAEAFRRSLEAGAVDDVVLWWKRIDMKTRIHFGEVAPELLFIWKQGGPSASSARYVIQQILAHRRSDPDAVTKLRTSVLAMSPGEIAKTSTLMQQFSLSKDEVLALVRELIAEHAIEPRFRIQTDRLIVDYENTWKEELVQLPDIVTDEDGRRISALEPSSIEVGYVRVSSVE